MAKARIKLNHAAMAELLHSSEVVDFLRTVAEPVESAVKQDPNAEYVAGVVMDEHHSKGRSSRGSIRVGSTVPFAIAVEAKRGTLARAVGSAGS